MNNILYWLYGWHYLAHGTVGICLGYAPGDCTTCRAWEDESLRRTQETHKRRMPKDEMRIITLSWAATPAEGRLLARLLEKDCDVHPTGCQGYVYHTGRRSDAPKREEAS